MEKLFVTGVSGLLGSNIAFMASHNFEVYGSYNTNPVNIAGCKCFKLDLTGSAKVSEAIDAIKPDLIIHCAANTNVDYCEKNHSEAWNQNVIGTENIAFAADKNESFLIYISTDSVFDGLRGCYSEDDIPNPVNYYALTKLEGERILQESNLEYLIARTNIYGWNFINKNSFAEWIIHSLQACNETTLFYDVFFSPILINNLIEFLFDLYDKDVRGVYHISGSERCSKLHFGEMIAEIFRLDSRYIQPIRVDEKNLFAPRPRDTSLNISKVSKLSDLKLLNVYEGLLEMKKLMDNGYINTFRKTLGA